MPRWPVLGQAGASSDLHQRWPACSAGLGQRCLEFWPALGQCLPHFPQRWAAAEAAGTGTIDIWSTRIVAITIVPRWAD